MGIWTRVAAGPVVDQALLIERSMNRIWSYGNNERFSGLVLLDLIASRATRDGQMDLP